MSVSVADGETRCPKCGGRSIAKSTSMLSEPNFSPQNFIQPGSHPTFLSTNPNDPHFIHQGGALVSPALPSDTIHISSSTGNHSACSPQIKRRNYSESPLSLDSKRRHATNTYQLNSLQLPTRRPQSLPRPDFMLPQTTGGLITGPLRLDQTPPFSLTLAPLQSLSTILSSGPSIPSKPLEAVIFSIPIPNKIRVLSQISPPLAQPKPPFPAYRVRGYVVAIDSPIPESVTQVTNAVFSALSVHHPVRIFHGPALVRRKESPCKEGDDFQSYLDTISQYHTLSAEISAYITTPASSCSPKTFSPISPKTIPPTSSQTSSQTRSQQAWQTQNPPLSPQRTQALGAPIALLPSYQLSHTDASASSIPIADAYAPVDHWQWMATLWRGIVGPDVTVAITAPEWSGPASHEKAIKNMGGSVEIRLEDSRSILLSSDGETGTILDGALRRVCFELSEWVRAGA